LLIKPKQQHGKNQNKNTGLFKNCMGFVVMRIKANKKFFCMLGNFFLRLKKRSSWLFF
jgi:hypothetical protein